MASADFAGKLIGFSELRNIFSGAAAVATKFVKAECAVVGADGLIGVETCENSEKGVFWFNCLDGVGI